MHKRKSFIEPFSRNSVFFSNSTKLKQFKGELVKNKMYSAIIDRLRMASYYYIILLYLIKHINSFYSRIVAVNRALQLVVNNT